MSLQKGSHPQALMLYGPNQSSEPALSSATFPAGQESLHG